MPNYKAHYEQLFDAVTEAIELLRKAQIDTVDTCIDEMRNERSDKTLTKINADFSTNSKEE